MAQPKIFVFKNTALAEAYKLGRRGEPKFNHFDLRRVDNILLCRKWEALDEINEVGVEL